MWGTAMTLFFLFSFLLLLGSFLQDISEERRYLRTLNDKVATAVSMLLFNLAALFIVREYSKYMTSYPLL